VSQSPLDAAAQGDEKDIYLNNWNRLAQLIREGHSLSGREPNCCFLNTGGPRFADVSAASGVDFPDDGRGLAVVDWDHDGDLDFWLANRTGPSIRCLLNQTNDEQRQGFLALQLQGTRCNRDAIGARVELVVAEDSKRSVRRIRTLRAGEGFLSQSSKWIHFGLGSDTQIQELRVRWPGDAQAEVFRNVHANGRYRIVQDTGTAITVAERKGIKLPISAPATRPAPAPPRIVLTQRPPLGSIPFQDANGTRQTLETTNTGRPLLVNLWASWCQPCIAELSELATHAEALRQPALDVLALCVDSVSDQAADADAAASRMTQLRWPFRWGMATGEFLQQLTEIDQRIFYRIKPLPLPCSVLLDTQGRIAVIYKGPVTHEQLLHDVALLSRPSADLLRAAAPFGGMNIASWFSPDGLHVAQAYLEGGYLDDAESTVQAFLRDPAAKRTRNWQRQQAEAYRLLARIARLRSNVPAQVSALREVARQMPDDLQALAELAMVLHSQPGQQDAAEQLLRRAEQVAGQSSAGLTLLAQARLQLGQPELAVALLQRAMRAEPANREAQFSLGLAYQAQGKLAEATQQYRAVLDAAPDFHQAANNLAWLLATQPGATDAETKEALRLAENLCRQTNHQVASYLDTLSVVLAAADQTEQSKAIAEQAIRMAQARGEFELVARIKRRQFAEPRSENGSGAAGRQL
jgi:tetratricopeptide (TPR) repeat protein